MIKQNQRVLNLSLVLLDMLCGAVSMVVAWLMWRVSEAGWPGLAGFPGLLPHLFLLLLVLPGNGVIFYFAGLYRAKRHKQFLREFFSIASSAATGLAFLLAAMALLDLHSVSRKVLVLYTLLLLLSDAAYRYILRLILRRIRRKGFNLKYLLMIGTGPLAKQFADRVRDNPQYGYRFYGCLSDHDPSKSMVGDLDVLGLISSLDRHLSKGNIDEVTVAIELYEYEKLPEVISCCEKHGIKANIIPAYYRYIPSNPRMEEFDGVPVMVLRKIPLSNPLYAFIKRTFDVVVSLLCIVLFSPIMLVSWLIVRCTTKESAIYRQERIGYNFKPFTMYKFRTMISAPPDDADAGDAHWTRKNDDRRTRSGVILRRFSIDELPQFFNVLTGKMSIVGPRPEIDAFVNQFKEEVPRYMVRHQVKPGITGWAQVQGLRGDTSIEERIKSDIYYIENWSLMLDIQIIIRTFLHAFYNPYE